MSTPTSRIVPADDGFARALFARLSAGEGNVVVSPASVEACLLLALAGARGETAAQIAEMLHVSGEKPADNKSVDVGQLLDRYRSLAAEPSQGKNSKNRLVIANSAWVQRNLPIHDAYRKLLETNRRATFELVDFAAETERARAAINAWVDTQTQHKIKELLAPGSLDSTARLVLANAIYFKGRWAKPFNKELTSVQPFRRPGAADMRMPMMHKDSRFSYLETDMYQALELSYADSGMAMVVWLPRKAENLAAVERGISSANIASSLSKLTLTSVDVFLPKFEIDQSTSLGDVLMALGMKDAFSPAADFSGITDERLALSAVVHQALVEVDEQGTEAAAASGAIAVTAAALQDRGEKKVFRADHPFVFAIRNRQTGHILFAGRVEKPAK